MASILVQSTAALSAAVLRWSRGGVSWLTVTAKDVARVDASGTLVPTDTEAVRLHDELAAGGVVHPSENQPLVPVAEIFVVGRMVAPQGWSGAPRGYPFRQPRSVGGSRSVVGRPVCGAWTPT